MINDIIREKRRLNFSFKRVTNHDIRNLAGIVEAEVSRLQGSNENDFFVVYSVDAIDNSSFESKSNVIFSDEEILGTKVVKRVSMRFYTSDYSKNIEIQLTHSVTDENLENYIMVSGDDSVWVNGILTKLTGIMNNSESQTKYYRSFIGWLTLLVVVVANVEFFRLFFDMVLTFNAIIGVILMIGLPVYSLIWLGKLNDHVSKMWPEMELQTGPLYLQHARKHRNFLKSVAVLIIIPTVLMIIYDVIKSIM